MPKKKKVTPYYTLLEASELLGMYKHDVRTLIHVDQIKYKFVNWFIQIDRVDLDLYIEQMPK